MNEIVYMRWNPKFSEKAVYYGLKPRVIYKCVRLFCGYKNCNTKRIDYWILAGFEQVSNVEVLTQIYTGKVIPEELPE
jgi:hypothetical protein